MKPLIINVRGNSGSGKTYLTRQFMNRCTDVCPISEGRDVEMKFNKRMWVALGKYTNVCGGCDTIKTQDEIIERVKHYTKHGYNVWLEGLILSTIYGRVGEYSEWFGDRWVFAYLQPPIELCIERIKARRAAAGNTEPFPETNTRNRVATIARNREIVLEHGRRVLDLPWEQPLPTILKLIRKEAK